MPVIADNDLQDRLRTVLNKGWIPLSDYPECGGTGAPGNILEKLLGVDGGNSDTPDAGKWEIKFHSGTALLTLFHLAGSPPKHMHHMVREFGKKNDAGHISFRHTIFGRSPQGFYVANESNRITVRHDNVSDIVWPYWEHDHLINAFVSKFRRLIVVSGKKRNGMVRYQTAHRYVEPHATQFIEAIERGIVAIDFDARTTTGPGLRNHGTKFRIKFQNLPVLYHDHGNFDPGQDTQSQ